MIASRSASRRWSRRGARGARPGLASCGAGALLLLTSLSPASPAGTVPRARVVFVNVAAASGLTLANRTGSPEKSTINETVGNGVCLSDIDNDGFIDIFLPNGQASLRPSPQEMEASALYRNRGDGTFEEITRKAGVEARGYWAQGCVFGDYDDDGLDDLVVTGFGRSILYKNLGQGRFKDVSPTAGFATGGWTTGAAFADYDGDGRIDLYISAYVDFDASSPPLPLPGSAPNCTYRGFPVMCGPRGLKPALGRLYHNEGGGRFKDATRTAGLPTVATGYGLGAIWSDFDLDGDLDLYVANDSTQHFLFRNDGGGRFAEVGTMSGVAYSEDGRAQAGMGVDSADYDNDGRFDLVVTNFSHDYSTLYHNEGDLFFLDVSMTSGFGPPTMMTLGWGVGIIDYDNDGRRDIFVANGHVYPGIDGYKLGTTWKQPNQLFRNEGDGRFRDASAESGPAFKEQHSARGSAFGDLDNDGDIDIVVSNIDEPPSLLRNDGGNASHWIGFRLEGARRNRGAIGARVTVQAGALRQVAEVHAGGSHNSSNDRRLLFGLGATAKIDRVQVWWPGGTSQTLTGLSAGRYHTIRQPDAPAR